MKKYCARCGKTTNKWHKSRQSYCVDCNREYHRRYGRRPDARRHTAAAVLTALVNARTLGEAIAAWQMTRDA
jgi:hypothetical protein